MMNPEIKAEWVKRLRSGDYEQGKGNLEMGGRYCCLGVLCEIAVEQGIAVKEIKEESRVAYYDREYVLLPNSVIKWAGVRSSNPDFGGWILSNLNDVENYDFNQIADVIEADEPSEPHYAYINDEKGA